jgi:AcrR family transcriptional regulator
VFCDHGQEAPLEEIARRAGVGIGTLYRRFPSRVQLLDAVLADAVQAHVDVAERALAMEDPWDGFAYYLEETCRLQAEPRNDRWACGSRRTAMEAAKARQLDVVAQVVDRAQQSGQLRADLTWRSRRQLGQHPHPTGCHAAGAPDACEDTRPPAGRRRADRTHCHIRRWHRDRSTGPRPWPLFRRRRAQQPAGQQFSSHPGC